MSYILENKEWIFSGVGVLVLSLIISIVLWVLNKRKKNTKNYSIEEKPERIVNQYGEKSQYIENNIGDINIS